MQIGPEGCPQSTQRGGNSKPSAFCRTFSVVQIIFSEREIIMCLFYANPAKVQMGDRPDLRHIFALTCMVFVPVPSGLCFSKFVFCREKVG